VDEGQLHVNSGAQLGTGALTVKAGAILSGVTTSKVPFTNSSVTINGTLQVGSSATSTLGSMYFNNKNVTFASGSTYKVALRRCATASNNGGTSIEDINRLTVNGTIEVLLAESYEPVAGDSMRIWICKSFSGTPEFALPALANGFKWNTSRISEGVLFIDEDKRGDVNNDGNINVTDIVAVASYILGTNTNISLDAADCNYDNEINVTDIVAIANVILGISPEEVSSLALLVDESDISFDILPFIVEPGEEVEVGIKLNSPGESGVFTAFQFNIVLPDGIGMAEDMDGYVSVNLTERTSSRKHTLDCAKQADGSYTVLCYSTGLSTFSGEGGDVMTMKIKASENIEKKVFTGEIKDAVITRTDQSEAKPEPKSFTIFLGEETSVNGLASSALTIIPGKGMVTIKSDTSVAISIYSVNGNKVASELIEAGSAVVKLLPAGVYFIEDKKFVVY
jgi:hypothetical protein